MFIILIPIEFTNLASGVERSNEGGILVSWPVLDGEDERILRELLRTVGEGEVAVQTEPGVVEPEAHEGEQEVNLFVDLRNGVSDVLLIVSNVVTASSLDNTGYKIIIIRNMQ